MKIKCAITAFTILVSASINCPLEAQSGSSNSGNSSVGQNNGFRIGQTGVQNPAAPSLSPSPVQGITNPIQAMGNPIQGMTNTPILPLGGGIAQPENPAVAPRIPAGTAVLTPGATIFVPPGTLVVENNDALLPGAVLSAPETGTAISTQGGVRPSSSTPSTTSTTGTTGTTGRSANGRDAQGQRVRTTSSPAGTAATTLNGTELGTTRDKVIERFGNPVAFMMGMNGETLYFNNGVVVFVKDGVVATPGQ
jgi:hypothetical protein